MYGINTLVLKRNLLVYYYSCQYYLLYKCQILLREAEKILYKLRREVDAITYEFGLMSSRNVGQMFVKRVLGKLYG